MRFGPDRRSVGSLGTLADIRHGAVVTRLADDNRGGGGVGHRSVRRMNLDAAQMRMLGEIGHAVDLGERNVGVRQSLQEIDAHHGGKAVADSGIGQVAIANALDHVGKSGIVGQIGLAQYISA